MRFTTGSFRTAVRLKPYESAIRAKTKLSTRTNPAPQPRPRQPARPEAPSEDSPPRSQKTRDPSSAQRLASDGRVHNLRCKGGHGNGTQNDLDEASLRVGKGYRYRIRHGPWRPSRFHQPFCATWCSCVPWRKPESSSEQVNGKAPSHARAARAWWKSLELLALSIEISEPMRVELF